MPLLQGAVNRDSLVIPVARGLLRYPNPEHAVTSGYQRHVIHELQPRRAAPTTFFGGTNNFIDIELPQDLHYVDKMDVHLDLKNNDAADTSFNNIPSNLFSRVELRIGSEIKETITDIEAWTHQIPYSSPWELDKQEVSTKTASDTYKVDFDIAATTTASTIRVPLRNVISQCAIPTAAISDQVTVRLYSQNAT